jgi:hypothetical protein
VKVEVLVVPDCPNESAAVERVRVVLEEMGCPPPPLTIRVINSQTEADEVGFLGSPTFLIDGVDPFAEPSRAPALACRVYPTSDGLRGLPDATALGVALRAAHRAAERQT